MNLLYLLALSAGSMLALQSSVNSKLGKVMGNPSLAAFTSFLIGIIGISIYLLVTRPHLPALADLAKAPAWTWIGGLLGSIYVTTVIIIAPKIGISTLSGLVIGGQLGMSIIIDHFGLFGVPQSPISLGRAIGAALILIGAVMVRKF